MCSLSAIVRGADRSEKRKLSGPDGLARAVDMSFYLIVDIIVLIYNKLSACWPFPPFSALMDRL